MRVPHAATAVDPAPARAHSGAPLALMAAPLGVRTIVLRRFYPPSPVASGMRSIGRSLGRLASLADRHGGGSGAQTASPSRSSMSTGAASRSAAPSNGRTADKAVTVENPDRRGFHARSLLLVAFLRDPPHRAAEGGAWLVVEQTDRYDGLAFFIFRYFALRREMAAL